MATQGVTVNCVAPRFTRKDAAGHAATSSAAMASARMITPTGNIATPADIAATVAFLLIQEVMQITGQVIHLDGGLVLP